MSLSAFIFDMDDLLVFTAPLWRSAEETLLAALGQKWTPEVALQYKGMNSLDVAATLHRIYPPAWPLERSRKIMRDALLANFERGAEPMPGAVELVRRLRDSFRGTTGRRLPMAVASGSPLPAIEGVMQRLGIRHCFDQIISSESVPRGKPHPDVFLAAATALGARPGECLVFEDSLIGVRAGIAAGMRVFSVPSGSHDEIAALATKVFASLGDIGERDLAAMV